MAENFEERRKELAKHTTELVNVTKTLSPTMKSAVDSLKSINVESALIVANMAKNNKDTFSGMLSNRKLAKAEKSLANQELSAATNSLTEIFKQQEASLLVARDKDNALKKFGDELVAAEIKYNSEKKDQFTSDLNAELNYTKAKEEVQKKIHEREKKINDLFNDDIESANARESSARKTYNKEVEDAGKTEGFDKFAAGLSTMTGGILDIAGPLDSAVKQWGAFKDVASFVGTPFKKLGKVMDGMPQSIDENHQAQMDASEESQAASAAGTKIQGLATKRLKLFTAGILMNTLAMGLNTLKALAAIGAIAVAAAAAAGLIAKGVEEGAFAGIGVAVTKATKTISDAATKTAAAFKGGAKTFGDGFKSLARSLGFKIPTTPPPSAAGVTTTTTGTPPPRPLRADGKPDMRFKANKLLEEGAEGTAKGGWLKGIKGATKWLVKKLPFIGGAAETGIDAFSQYKSMESLIEARESGALTKAVVGEDGEETGERRNYTDAEFEALQVAYQNNKEGSVGRGVGSTAGAMATGLVAGKVGATIGMFLGGPLGAALLGTVAGIGGAIYGSMKGGDIGDDIATKNAERRRGGEDSQALINDAIANIQVLEPNENNNAQLIKEGNAELNNGKSGNQNLGVSVQTTGGNTNTDNTFNINNPSTQDSDPTVSKTASSVQYG